MPEIYGPLVLSGVTADDYGGGVAEECTQSRTTRALNPASQRTDFEHDVAAVLDSLRPGDVVTYGEVAAEAGRPGAHRAVGSFLKRSGGEFPWWRVVTSTGRLVPHNETEQIRRLDAEGVEVRDGRVIG